MSILFDMGGYAAFVMDSRAQGGTWSAWYGDLMKQHVKDPSSGSLVGISYLEWQSGTPIRH